MGRLQPFGLVDERTGSTVVEELELADGYWSRLAGLQFRAELPPNRGLLLVPCRSLHTHWMRFPIDVATLDEDGFVLEVFENVRPWRIVMPKRRSHAVLETAAHRLTVQVGSRLVVPEASRATVPRSLAFVAPERPPGDA